MWNDDGDLVYCNIRVYKLITGDALNGTAKVSVIVFFHWPYFTRPAPCCAVAPGVASSHDDNNNIVKKKNARNYLTDFLANIYVVPAATKKFLFFLFFMLSFKQSCAVVVRPVTVARNKKKSIAS